MKTSVLVILVALSVVACASHYQETSTSTLVHWEGRDISQLIDAIGPFDTTSIKGDSRSYNWFRLGNCRLTAHTALDDKIQAVELEGTGQGCDAYRQKLGTG